MPKPSIFVKAAAAAAVAMVFFTAYEALTSVFFPYIVAWHHHSLSILMGAAVAFTATVAVQWRLQTEHNLVEREKANFAAVIENLPGLTVTVNTNNKFVRWNSRFQQRLGYSDAELAQMPAQTTIAEDYRELVPQIMGRAWTEGHAEMEAAWVTKSGKRIPCYLTGVRIVEDNQTLILSVGIDISEQKRAEEKLRKSEEQYRRLLSNLPDVTWTSDINGKTTYISTNVERVLGYTAEEICEHDEQLWLGRIHPADSDRVISGYRSLYDGCVFDVEYRIRHDDGRWIWVHDRSHADP
jgi:PAS domain S-box-containing protein